MKGRRKLSQSQCNYIRDLVNSGKMKPNQARKLCGLEPLDGGDDYIVSGKFSSQEMEKPDTSEKAPEKYGKQVVPVVKVKTEKVWYLCDGQGCSAKCGRENPDCRHTSDVNHTVNFRQHGTGSYWEKDERSQSYPVKKIRWRHRRRKISDLPQTGCFREVQ